MAFNKNSGPTGLASLTYPITGGGRNSKNLTVREKDARSLASRATNMSEHEFESQRPNKRGARRSGNVRKGESRIGMGIHQKFGK